MTSSQVDAAIDTLDIQSWEVTSLPEGAEKTGSANVSYSGTDAPSPPTTTPPSSPSPPWAKTSPSPSPTLPRATCRF